MGRDEQAKNTKKWVKPFSQGARYCLGKFYAEFSVRMLLHVFLQEFEFAKFENEESTQATIEDKFIMIRPIRIY